MADADKSYALRSTADVIIRVEKARSELLEADGSIKRGCIEKVW